MRLREFLGYRIRNSLLPLDTFCCTLCSDVESIDSSCQGLDEMLGFCSIQEDGDN